MDAANWVVRHRRHVVAAWLVMIPSMLYAGDRLKRRMVAFNRLVGRVAEVRRASPTMPEAAAIVEGVARTGRVITFAAALMVVVFGAFAVGDYLPSKLLGFTLAVAVLTDATLIRPAIGPALLQLAGRWNWWPGERRRGFARG